MQTKYYSRRSAQNPRPKEEAEGQEGQVNTLKNGDKRQEAKDPLYHPEAKAQRGEVGEREAKRR